MELLEATEFFLTISGWTPRKAHWRIISSF